MTSTPPLSQSQLLQGPPDTQPVQRFSSLNGYRTGDLSQGRQAVLKDLGRYLQVPYATLIHSAFGSPPDTSQIRQNLIERRVLHVAPDGMISRWAGFATTPAQSSVSESVAFQPLADIIPTIFNQIPNCQVSFVANPSVTPLSECNNTSRPDAYIAYSVENKIHWFDIAVPFEFKKAKKDSARRDNEQKMIWALHHIMREDPLRRFVLGITIEDTDMRLWYSHRAFLAVSVPIDLVKDIDDVISLFCLIGNQSVEKEKLGWDPTVERVLVGQTIQYKFNISGQVFTTTRPLATYGADAIVSRGTRVYEARDENKNVVVIKDSWRDKDRELEGAILQNIFQDIQEKLGEKEAAEAKKYFVRVRTYEDVVVSGRRDDTLDLRQEGSVSLKWITLNVDPILSEKRHLRSTGLIPYSDRPPGSQARAPSLNIPCRVHTRTVFEEIGTTLMNVTRLGDNFTCLSGALKALYYLHKVGWVHRDFSVANVLWVEKDGQWIGKLTDFEYAKKVSSKASHDVRTGTMHFMAVEVEYQRYLFRPQSDLIDESSDEPTDILPFRMNFLHDLESLWWAAVWVVFHNTDANSPTEDLSGQIEYYNQAFPCAIGQGSRRHFFTIPDILKEAYRTLSTTYRSKCVSIINLAKVLRGYYTEAEKTFPLLSLDDKLLEDVHKKVSDAVEQLKESNIYLRSLHELQERKRNVDDSPTHRPEKKAKQV